MISILYEKDTPCILFHLDNNCQSKYHEPNLIDEKEENICRDRRL